MEPGVINLVKEFYANMGKHKNLKCYVRGDGSFLGKGSSPNSLSLN